MPLPYRLTIAFIVILLTSCKDRKAVTTTSPDTTKIPAKDTVSSDEIQGHRYVEHARLNLPDQVITLTSLFAVVNGKVDEECHYDASSNYFVRIDKKTGKADTVEAGLDNLGGSFDPKFIIRDMTDSFQLKSLVVQIVTQAEDIYYANSFVGMKDGQFQKLFEISDTREDGVRLHRQGSKLIGKIVGRDEVVENLEFDYPVEVDTKTFEEVESTPSRQYIGYKTYAAEAFRAHRVIGGVTDSSLMAVKEGAEVMVDSIYRDLGKVRLHVHDSVEVEIKIETAKEKLGHNGAG